MPANLTPQYKEAEEAYKAARDPQEKLLCLERMLALIPKHKGTEKMQADLKRRIAQTKEALESQRGKKGFAVKVEAEGAAQVVLVGAPNAGKSSLVEATTNARVEVGDHPFSTRLPVPAMLGFEDLQFQLVDLPPVSREHMEYWVTDIVRNADAALWAIDVSDPDLAAKVEEVRSILAERKIELRPPDEAGGRQEIVRRLSTAVLATKCDADRGGGPALEALLPGYPLLRTSALSDSDFSALGRILFEMNRLVRVYAKAPGKDPERSKPFLLRRGDRVIDFAKLVHKDFAERLQFARVWGTGKFDGQRVQREEPLTDGDVIELHA